MARFAFASAVLCCCAALAACGGDETTTVPAETTVPATTTTVSDSTTATTADEPPAQPSSISRTGEATFFRSPTGKIGCAASKTSVRCDISAHEWTAPPPAEPCSLDYGNGIAVGEQGPAQFTCAGDTVLDPGAPVLAYGEYVELYGYRCESRSSGMRCENEATGNGFSLSRERVDPY